MTMYRLSDADLAARLGDREGVTTFAAAPTRRIPWVGAPEGDASAGEARAEALRRPRAAQSPKGIFFPASESVGRYGPRAASATQVLEQLIVVVGVRACELRARNYLDKVFLEGDFQDAGYRRRREQTVLVACDCVDCTETCCCTLVDGRPFATEGFDVNLTPLADGFLAEVGTERGQEWLAAGGTGDLREASPDALAERDALREGMVKRLEEQNEPFGFAASDAAAPPLPDDADDAWLRFAADCVECGACTHVCPTCHCFYLYDQVLGPEEFERLRAWDSCLLSTYHRMAGGVHVKLTPRPKLSSRLANRVLHKFIYSPQQYALLGCVGCGRCIDACPGAIDIREVVQELSR